MRIQVRDDTGKPLGAIQIKVIDLDAKAAAKQPGSWRKLERWLLKSAVSSSNTRKKTKNDTPDIKTIEIKVSLPDFRRWPKPPQLVAMLRQASRRTLAALVLAVLVLAVGGYSLARHYSSTSTAQAATSSGPPQLTRGTPKYKTVLPAGKTITSLGGWARVSPANKAPAYAYSDRLDSVHIIVSEQPLPPKFIGDTDIQVAQLAQNFNATEKFSAGDTTVYIATESDGTQYVILSKSNLLILIKADAGLTNDQWVGYINSLQ